MSHVARLLAVGYVVAAFAVVAAAQDTANVYRPGNGVTRPRVMKDVKPKYTDEARAAGIQGTVVLDVVVQEDGKVGEVKVAKSLDTTYGLDDQAVNAMKQWLFSPGTKDDKPVAVRVEIEMTFRLK